MNSNQLAEVARILGVSEDSISAMDDEIRNSMTAVFEQVAIKNDKDKKAVYEALDKLWQTERLGVHRTGRRCKVYGHLPCYIEKP